MKRARIRLPKDDAAPSLDGTRGERVIAFIETYCIVPEGEHIGKPMLLEPFQKRFILAVYDNPTGTRRAYLSMGRKNGKALALDTPLPTPSGWTTMGAVQEGDELFDETGTPCRVTFATDVQHKRDCYKVLFADGSKIIADADHQWEVCSRRARKNPQVLTTQEMVDRGVQFVARDKAEGFNYSVPTAGPIVCPEADLRLAPYTLGFWLGDGATEGASLTIGEQDAFEVASRIETDGYPIRNLPHDPLAWSLSDGVKHKIKPDCVLVRLRELGVLGNKHIPAVYQRASIEQRTELLKGLMDSDGYCSKDGQCQYTSTVKQLAVDVLELVHGLGFKTTFRTENYKFEGRHMGLNYQVSFHAKADRPVFNLKRKVARQKPDTGNTRGKRNYIVAIGKVASVPVKCIQVDSPSSLFLAGKGFTPTHNTAIVAAIVLAHVCGPEASKNTQIISGAQSRDQAALVYNLASKMVMLNPDLNRICRIIPSSKKIVGLTRNVEYHAISAEGKTAYGLSPVLALLDEVGQVRGPQDNFIDAITTSQGAHGAPLLIAISTQAPNDADMFSVWIDDAIASKDKRIVCHLYTTDPSCDLKDRESWKAANPALGKFRSLDDVKEQAERASRMPSFEPTFRNLVLNQRCETFSPFVSKNIWVLNSEDVDVSAFYECPVYVGLDLSGKSDLTAAVLIAYKGKWQVKPIFWTPEKGLRDRARVSRTPLPEWAKAGHLRVVPGACIDYEYIAKDLVDILDGMDVRAVGFDRWRFDLLKKELDETSLKDLPLIPFGQGFKDMSPALESLETFLLNEQIAHGGHPVLTMCALNARTEKDAAGNRKLSKVKAVGWIDGMVGLTMAVGVANTPKEKPKTYDAFFV